MDHGNVTSLDLVGKQALVIPLTYAIFTDSQWTKPHGLWKYGLRYKKNWRLKPCCMPVYMFGPPCCWGNIPCWGGGCMPGAPCCARNCCLGTTHIGISHTDRWKFRLWCSGLWQCAVWYLITNILYSYSKDESMKFHCNIGTYLANYMVLHPKILALTFCEQLFKSHVSAATRALFNLNAHCRTSSLSDKKDMH